MNRAFFFFSFLNSSSDSFFWRICAVRPERRINKKRRAMQRAADIEIQPMLSA
ncbi:MAG: hypothetical protein ACLRUN_07095 [Christensenellales bacterium]